jgi:energy-coupling factor transporter ATP-binding protein EcfA2
MLQQTELTLDDENEILSMLKQEFGLIKDGEISIKPKPINIKDISGAIPFPKIITLKAISNLQNVNAIPDGANLPFGHEGITVIYGENGTGKSGYARVLKRACNARDTKENILPNVFCKEELVHPSAQFKISLNGGPDEEITWEIDKHNEILLNICFFDSKCARVIVDENNDVAYIPYGAQVFENLVQLLANIRSQLEKEKPPIKALSYVDIPPETVAGKILKELSADTPTDRIEQIVWTEENETKFKTLKKYIMDWETKDLDKQSKRIRSIKERAEYLIGKIDLIDVAITNERNVKIGELIDLIKEAEKAVALVSEGSFQDEPLSGIGGSAWELLYKAAKEYSVKYAYPGEDFPVTRDGSICVLCLQPLSKEAVKRLVKFKLFVEQSAKKTYDALWQQLNNEIEQVNKLDIPDLGSIGDLLNEIDDRNKDLGNSLREYINGRALRKEEILKTTRLLIRPDIDFISNSPKSGISSFTEVLDQEIAGLEELSRLEDIDHKKLELREMESLKAFANKKTDILEYLRLIKQAKLYEKAISQTDTKAITIQGKSIVSSSLTPQLLSNLKTELGLLGASHIPISLIPSGSKGETRHKLTLQDIKNKKVSLSEVLSEGEQRVVAISGFFAELSLSLNKCPIVFDDPVTSLDHRYREKIASRLVLEGRNRQVIIFTHDISFLVSLEEKASEIHDVSLVVETVRRDGMECGKIIDGEPWHSMKTSYRLKYIEEELGSIKDMYTANMEEYNKKAAVIYGLLRETWEAMIEEVLLEGTIRRFVPSVETQRLRKVMVETEDYLTIDRGMSKCSTWMIGHDKSKSLDSNRPCPDEVLEDVKMLGAFTARIKKRNEATEKERKEELKPKKSNVG